MSLDPPVARPLDLEAQEWLTLVRDGTRRYVRPPLIDLVERLLADVRQLREAQQQFREAVNALVSAALVFDVGDGQKQDRIWDAVRRLIVLTEMRAKDSQ